MAQGETHVAMRRIGITIPIGGRSLTADDALLGRLSDLGFTDVWTQETDGPDALTPLAWATAKASPDVRLGCAIASVFTRGPALLAMQAAALADAAPGRFVLGIGSSSLPIVTGWNGLPFERPLARVRDTLRFLRRALAGERVDFEGETFSSRGFRLERPPAAPPPVYVAALGPRMLDLAAREADGVILSLVSPDDLPAIVDHLGRDDEAPRAREIVLRVGVIASPDADAARAHCRRIIAGYLSVDRYAALHRWLGRGAALEPMWRAWAAGDRERTVALVPDALVDGLFVHGDVDACREGLRRFRAAGVTTPVLALMGWAGRLEPVVEALGDA